MSTLTLLRSGGGSTRSVGARLRRRLKSRSDVKRTQCACRSQNRSLLRRGRS